jgi:hypothetical protein
MDHCTNANADYHRRPSPDADSATTAAGTDMAKGCSRGACAGENLRGTVMGLFAAARAAHACRRMPLQLALLRGTIPRAKLAMM